MLSLNWSKLSVKAFLEILRNRGNIDEVQDCGNSGALVLDQLELH